MLTTIEIGSCVSVQGEFVGRLGDGQTVVRDGSKLYCGRLIGKNAEGPEMVPHAVMQRLLPSGAYGQN